MKGFKAKSGTNLAQKDDNSFNSIRQGGRAHVSIAPPPPPTLQKRFFDILGRGAAQTKGFVAQSSTNVAQTNDICFIVILGGGGGGGGGGV